MPCTTQPPLPCYHTVHARTHAAKQHPPATMATCCSNRRIPIACMPHLLLKSKATHSLRASSSLRLLPPSPPATGSKTAWNSIPDDQPTTCTQATTCCSCSCSKPSAATSRQPRPRPGPCPQPAASKGSSSCATNKKFPSPPSCNKHPPAAIKEALRVQAACWLGSELLSRFFFFQEVSLSLL